MGRIKELKDKQADGTISKAEVKELEELLAEAEVEVEEEEQDEASDEEESEAEDKAIEQASEKLASSFMAKIKPLEELADKLSESEEKVTVKQESKFVVDPEMGKVSVSEL